MKIYHLHNGKEEVGRFTFDELTKMKLDPNFFIWHDGISNWMPILQVAEIAPFVESKSVKFDKTNKADLPKQKTKTYEIVMGLFILTMVIIGLAPELKYYLKHSSLYPKKQEDFNEIIKSETANLKTKITPDILSVILKTKDTSAQRLILNAIEFVEFKAESQRGKTYLHQSESSFAEVIKISPDGDSVIYNTNSKDIYDNIINLVIKKDEPPVSLSQRPLFNNELHCRRYNSTTFFYTRFINKLGSITIVKAASGIIY